MKPCPEFKPRKLPAGCNFVETVVCWNCGRFEHPPNAVGPDYDDFVKEPVWTSDEMTAQLLRPSPESSAKYAVISKFDRGDKSAEDVYDDGFFAGLAVGRLEEFDQS